MSAASLILLGVGTALALLALVSTLRRGAEARRLAAQRRRAEIFLSEARLFVEGREQIAAMQDIAEASVGGGTAAVRAVHKGIASIPFTILEAIPVTRDTTRIVRGIHDLTADAVYGTISAINREIHKQARRGLQLRGTPAASAVSAEAGAKPATDPPALAATDPVTPLPPPTDRS